MSIGSGGGIRDVFTSIARAATSLGGKIKAKVSLARNTAALVKQGLLEVDSKGELKPTEKAEKIASTTSGKADFLSSARKRLDSAASSATTTVRNFQKAVSSLVGYGNGSIATDEDFKKFLDSGELSEPEVKGFKGLNLTRGQLNNIMKVPKEKMKELAGGVFRFAMIVQGDPGMMSRLLRAESKNAGYTHAEVFKLSKLGSQAASEISKMHILTGIPSGECLDLYTLSPKNFAILLNGLDSKELKQLGADKDFLKELLKDGYLSPETLEDVRDIGKPFNMDFNQLITLSPRSKLTTLTVISKVLKDEVKNLSSRDLNTLLELGLNENELTQALQASRESRKRLTQEHIKNLSNDQLIRFLDEQEIPRDKLVEILVKQGESGSIIGFLACEPGIVGLPERMALLDTRSPVSEAGLAALSIHELNRAVALSGVPRDEIAEAMPQIEGLSLAVCARIFKEGSEPSLSTARLKAQAKGRMPQTALVKKIIEQDKAAAKAAERAENAWVGKTNGTMRDIREKLQQAKAKVESDFEALQALIPPGDNRDRPDRAALYTEAEAGKNAFLESIGRVEEQLLKMQSKLAEMTADEAAKAMDPNSDFASELRTLSHTASGVAKPDAGATRAKVNRLLTKFAHALGAGPTQAEALEQTAGNVADGISKQLANVTAAVTKATAAVKAFDSAVKTGQECLKEIGSPDGSLEQVPVGNLGENVKTMVQASLMTRLSAMDKQSGISHAQKQIACCDSILGPILASPLGSPKVRELATTFVQARMALVIRGMEKGGALLSLASGGAVGAALPDLKRACDRGDLKAFMQVIKEQNIDILGFTGGTDLQEINSHGGTSHIRKKIEEGIKDTRMQAIVDEVCGQNGEVMTQRMSELDVGKLIPDKLVKLIATESRGEVRKALRDAGPSGDKNAARRQAIREAVDLEADELFKAYVTDRDVKGLLPRGSPERALFDEIGARNPAMEGNIKALKERFKEALIDKVVEQAAEPVRRHTRGLFE